MNGPMQMIAICQEFGWTYEEYQSQPDWFLRLIREKMIRDNKEQQLRQKQHNRGK